MASNEKIIWDFCKVQGLNDYGAAGLCTRSPGLFLRTCKTAPVRNLACLTWITQSLWTMAFIRISSGIRLVTDLRNGRIGHESRGF